MSYFSQGLEAQLTGMGGPDEPINPANSGIPLVEGGNPAWNDFLQHVPEDKRQEVVPVLQKWDQDYQKLNDEYKPWKDLSKSGIDAERAQYALQVQAAIENNPQMVYETLGKHLGISTKEAKELVEDTQANGGTAQATDDGDSRYKDLESKFMTLAQYVVKQREAEQQAETVKQQEAKLDQELSSLKEKFGEFDEEEVVMRMLHKGLSAEDALNEWAQKHKRSNPRLMGAGGMVPRPSISPEKLDAQGTKSLVAQMLGQANAERNG